MPTVKIPLVGSYDTRGLDSDSHLLLDEDQRFLNCVFEVVQNPVTGKSKVLLKKRPGWGVDTLVSSGLAATALIKPSDFNAPFSAFGETNSAVYVGSIHVGNITGRALHLTETLVSASSYVLLKSSDGTGWYYPDGAKDVLTYTGDTISGDFRVSSIASTLGIYTGQLVTGGQMGAGARVTSVNFATSTIGLSIAATATSTGAVITKEPVAKILDADFLSSMTYHSAFAAMDGYHFYATDDGYINNSDLNSVSVYSATGRLAVQQSPDPSVAVAIQNNKIVVLGTHSKEVFQNAGIAVGSPLLRIAQYAERIGCVDQRSLTQFEDDIYFVSTPHEGDIGIYRIRGLQAQRISTPAVDRILGSNATDGAIYANSFRMGGQAYATFSLSLASDGPNSNLLQESGDALLLEDADNILTEDLASQSAAFIRLLVYNINLNIWSEWDCDEATFIDGAGSGTGNQVIAVSRFVSTGAVYKIDPVSQGDIYQDASSTFSLEVRTSKLNFGSGNRKIMDEVRLICDQQATGNAYLSYSDDDYGTWSTPRAFDLTKPEPKITRLGAFNARALKITHSTNAAFRAEAIEVVYREATG